MKNLSTIFTIIALILSHVMCTVLAYNYRDALCAIDHAGFSAPASIVFILAVPFVIGIIVCALLAIKFRKK